MDVRSIRADELTTAGALLFQSFEQAAKQRGYGIPWRDEQDAADMLARYHESDPNGVVVAETGGAIVGVGCMRTRGEVSTVGPIAVIADGRGIGSAVLDQLLERADADGSAATRLYVDAWNPSSYALYTGKGFSVVDVVAHIEREPTDPPRIDTSRGLEVREAQPGDFEDILRLDQKITGYDRPRELERLVRLVARRRGNLVGYIGVAKTSFGYSLGPAVAADASDLFTLLGRTLADLDGSIRSRLSTSAPAASMAALGLGFRVRELGIVMSRGTPPPTRTPQLYCWDPELL